MIKKIITYEMKQSSVYLLVHRDLVHIDRNVDLQY